MTTGSWRRISVRRAMVLESFALVIYLAVSGERTTALAVLGGIFAVQFGIVVLVQIILRRDTGDDDEHGSDGGGPGRRRGPVPRRPPPAGPVCWSEFERQFAEYVAGGGISHDRQPAGKRPSPGSDDAARALRPEHAADPTPRGGPMAKPMFFYAGIYDNSADAELDYEAIKSLHRSAAIGSYDSAIIVHRHDGEVKVTKSEKPAHNGAWIGLAAGAGAAVVFPFLLPAVSYAGMAGAGAGLGAWFGHLAHGTSRGEAKDIGAMLEPGTTALVVVGIDRDAEAIERAADRAKSHTLKRQFGDWDEAEQDALESIARAEQQAVA